ncbi:lipoprotein-releasing ABC transporter permease subunit [Reinekea marina]|uniref:Lipoprotein-releasing ABC transporter permease subunit n=1 Tax=Reinekea marina TaxID=1310421 RepID=A0ABV7WVW5_9GAMM|nr:lipoprotein-releasing ABC transporter permease subunit [Reinekea marina]MDN3649620.1 lipoprotein-releasing ABC transporter permease subunit [Reinekea marina]
MFQSLPLYIGLRYIRAKRRNHFISFISAVSMIGLTLGVAVLIIVLSVMNGFDRELRTRILGMVPHATISQPGEMTNAEQVRAIALEHPRVLGASAYVQTQGMLVGSRQTKGALLSGIEPSTVSTVSILPNHLLEGDIENLAEGEFNVILGDNLARSIGAYVGDKITVLVPQLSVNIAGIQPRFKRFTVSGIFKVGAEVDQSLAVFNLNDLAKVLQYGNAVDGIQLKVDDLFKARSIAKEAGQSLEGYYRVSDWSVTQGNLFQAIQMEKRMVGLLLFMVIAVAGFNIVSSLVMLVTDKQGEIAVLRTIGATRSQVMGIFIVQGTVIGALGIVVGTLLGILGALTIADIIAWIESAFNIEFLNANVYFISYIPSQLQVGDIYTVSISAFVIAALSTIYPAWRASRISPAEVLRYES